MDKVEKAEIPLGWFEIPLVQLYVGDSTFVGSKDAAKVYTVTGGGASENVFIFLPLISR